jgi:hypothetical protein
MEKLGELHRSSVVTTQKHCMAEEKIKPIPYAVIRADLQKVVSKPSFLTIVITICRRICKAVLKCCHLTALFFSLCYFGDRSQPRAAKSTIVIEAEGFLCAVQLRNSRSVGSNTPLP